MLLLDNANGGVDGPSHCRPRPTSRLHSSNAARSSIWRRQSLAVPSVSEAKADPQRDGYFHQNSLRLFCLSSVRKLGDSIRHNLIYGPSGTTDGARSATSTVTNWMIRVLSIHIIPCRQSFGYISRPETRLQFIDFNHAIKALWSCFPLQLNQNWTTSTTPSGRPPCRFMWTSSAPSFTSAQSRHNSSSFPISSITSSFSIFCTLPNRYTFKKRSLKIYEQILRK